MSLHKPTNEAEVVALIEAAVANERPLEIVGMGSKQGLGRSDRPDDQISMAALSGVSMYEPEELVLTAGAGTPLREIRALLDQQGQELAFEPFDPAALYGGAPSSGTLGGIIAVNASGPRRIKAGAARDHLLGFKAVSGRAEVFKSGGRVMKNVTGYDLSKLITGSYGTLAIMTELTVKVMPKAETEQSLLVMGLGEAEALSVLRTASGSPHEVSSLAVVPAGVSDRVLPQPSGASAAILRLEGPEVSVLKRRDDLMTMLKATGASFETLPEPASKALWADLRDAAPIAQAQPAEAIVWRVSVAPTQAADVVAAIRAAGVPVAAHLYDWAGGLIWFALDPTSENSFAAAIRSVVDAHGGHATVMRAPDPVRNGVAVFHPQPGPLAALTARVKDAFDPKRVLNRGRMQPDF